MVVLKRHAVRVGAVYVPTEIVVFVQGLADAGILETTKGVIYGQFIVDGYRRILEDDLVAKALNAKKQLVAPGAKKRR